MGIALWCSCAGQAAQAGLRSADGRLAARRKQDGGRHGRSRGSRPARVIYTERSGLDAAAGGALRIGGVSVASRAFLAPMAGITDLPFRRLAARCGAGLVVSEMVAGDSLSLGNRESLIRAMAGDVEPHVVQLAGCTAEAMAEGARLAEAGGAAIVDINMGCPAKRVVGGWSGSALMRDPDHALKLIAAVVGAVTVPVTVKMRLGWDETQINAPEIARRAEAAGVAMITVHGRTRRQFYKGRADWAAIRAVREAVSVPLVANGDLMDVRDVDAMLAASGADAVMIGRGAYGRPWFPGQVAHYLATGAVLPEPDAAARFALLCEQYDAMLSHHGVRIGVRMARKHISWMLDAFENGTCAPDAPGNEQAALGSADPRLRALRARILKSEDAGEVMGLVADWFGAAGETRMAA